MQLVPSVIKLVASFSRREREQIRSEQHNCEIQEKVWTEIWLQTEAELLPKETKSAPKDHHSG